MTKKQEEAIKILSDSKILMNIQRDTSLSIRVAIETVLNMLKEKDKEAESYFKTTIMQAEKFDAKLEKKDKIIDLMAYDLADYVMYYEYSKCRNPVMIKDKAEELKEYYERKAEND